LVIPARSGFFKIPFVPEAKEQCSSSTSFLSFSPRSRSTFHLLMFHFLSFVFTSSFFIFHFLFLIFSLFNLIFFLYHLLPSSHLLCSIFHFLFFLLIPVLSSTSKNFFRFLFYLLLPVLSSTSCSIFHFPVISSVLLVFHRFVTSVFKSLLYILLFSVISLLV
jgi:hypothetical protein